MIFHWTMECFAGYSLDSGDHTTDGSVFLHQLIGGKHPILFRVSIIQGDAGFPSIHSTWDQWTMGYVVYDIYHGGHKQCYVIHCMFNQGKTSDLSGYIMFSPIFRFCVYVFFVNGMSHIYIYILCLAHCL